MASAGVDSSARGKTGVCSYRLEAGSWASEAVFVKFYKKDWPGFVGWVSSQ